ncbi:hypothetical protein H7200_02845 [Candidatus Saccharibacteria bacterium]|nr:hypothetical protein [Candidatus Saccharibacteria bacterium]
MTKTPDITEIMYTRAASSLKTHGILAIVFGGLGLLGGLIFSVFIGLGLGFSESSDDFFGLTAALTLTFIFWTLPHIYLIVSGYYLVKQPVPSVAKTLIIINLVVGAFWNLVILIFAIINLTQLREYAAGYAHRHNYQQ